MRRLGWIVVLSACSATSPGGTPRGEGAPASAEECVAGVSCAGCEDCVAMCVCSTGDPVGCPIACGMVTPAPDGDAGTSPPPPPPPATGGSGGSGGTSPTVCTYPPGPYGTSLGATLPPNLSWQGYRPDSDQTATISIQDYFDCDGTHGVNALLLIEAALWCGACQSEAEELNLHMAGGWSQQHISVLSLVIEDQLGNPASLSHALAWKNAFDAQGWGVVADPAFTFASGGGTGLPLIIVVDPRSMKVVDKSEGSGPGTYFPLEQLAAKNANQ